MAQPPFNMSCTLVALLLVVCLVVVVEALCGGFPPWLPFPGSYPRLAGSSRSLHGQVLLFWGTQLSSHTVQAPLTAFRELDIWTVSIVAHWRAFWAGYLSPQALKMLWWNWLFWKMSWIAGVTKSQKHTGHDQHSEGYRCLPKSSMGTTKWNETGCPRKQFFTFIMSLGWIPRHRRNVPARIDYFSHPGPWRASHTTQNR